MAPKNDRFTENNVNKGAWTEEEDRKLSQYIKTHGEKRWQTVAVKAGLNRCGKSCRLRWLNYLRPNIKRGNISDQEEDLIIRLHKLLGNRWSLIAGRLPGRTDNEIKNYWNSHLSKKLNHNQKKKTSNSEEQKKSRGLEKENAAATETGPSNKAGIPDTKFDVEMFLDPSGNGTVGPILSSYNQQFMEGIDYLQHRDQDLDLGLDLDFEWVTQFLEPNQDFCDLANS